MPKAYCIAHFGSAINDNGHNVHANLWSSLSLCLRGQRLVERNRYSSLKTHIASILLFCWSISGVFFADLYNMSRNRNNRDGMCPMLEICSPGKHRLQCLCTGWRENNVSCMFPKGIYAYNVFPLTR